MAAPKRSYINSAGNKTGPAESTNIGLYDFGMVMIGDDSADGICPICFGRMTPGGANNEHILSNTEYKKIFGSNMSDEDYNAEWNLMQAHSRCNSSKGTRGIFVTWLDGIPKPNLSPDQFEALCSILENHASRGKSSIGNFAKGNYKTQLQYIVQVVSSRSREAIERYIKDS